MNVVSDRTFHLEIVTPERLKYTDDVTMVSLPGVEGQLSMLAMHAPILAMLEPGHLMIRSQNQEIHMAVGHGFVKMSGNRAVCLVDFAEQPKEINGATVQSAIRDLEKELAQQSSSSSPRSVSIRSELREQKARLGVAGRK